MHLCSFINQTHIFRWTSPTHASSKRHVFLHHGWNLGNTLFHRHKQLPFILYMQWNPQRGDDYIPNRQRHVRINENWRLIRWLTEYVNHRAMHNSGPSFAPVINWRCKNHEWTQLLPGHFLTYEWYQSVTLSYPTRFRVVGTLSATDWW